MVDGKTGVVMRKYCTAFGFMLVLYALAGGDAAGATVEDQPPPNGCKQVEESEELPPTTVLGASISPPLQLETLTLFEPTAFASAGRTYVMYELYLRNFARTSFSLRGIEVVVTATDGIPDNLPRTGAGFRTAVPITADTVAGNVIALDLEGGQFAHYAHLQSGSSLRVKVGDRVGRGQVLARIGSSGDARAPHLHFQVTTTSSGMLAGEGVPYLIDEYRVKLPDDTWETRRRELPMSDMLIDFGQARSKPQLISK